MKLSMKLKSMPAVITLLLAAVAIDYGCGGGSSAPNPLPSVLVQASPTSNSMTVPLAANTALPIPPLAGFSGTFTEVNNVAAGTTVRLTTQITPPAGAPSPLTAARKRLRYVSEALALAASAGTPVVWVSQIYSAGVTFNAFPVTTWKVPPSMNLGSPFELEMFDGTTGTLIDIELPTGISGDTVTFGGSAAPFTTVASHMYWWELITGFPSASPTPTATPCGQGSKSVTLNPLGQQMAVPAACGFSGSVNIAANNAPAGVQLNIVSYVPGLAAQSGAPAKPGTTNSIFTLSADVSQNITFNGGMFQFAVTLPSRIATAGKTFFMSSCTILSKSGAHGNNFTDRGCTDNPFVVGPLPVSGQTITYSGLPFSLTLPALATCGPNGKECNYYYRASIYY